MYDFKIIFAQNDKTMNPSADGWIKKLLKEVSKKEVNLQLPETTFYHQLKLCGYIYGNNVSVLNNVFEKNDWTDEELCKVNHILALYYIHQSNSADTDFVETSIQFYNAIDTYKESFIRGLMGKKKSSILLESIIERRIHLDDNLISKNFNYYITNAFLFIDILAYQKFLNSNSISDRYLKMIEVAIETIALKVFELKPDKTKYDLSLIKLFESSVRYKNKERKTYEEVIKYLKNPLEKHYGIDIACMAAWTDSEIDHKELTFLNRLGDDLCLNNKVIQHAITDINMFYIGNKEQIALFSKKNMAQSFYDNSTKIVIKLINRNSKRLLKELRESKELMLLLTKSTQRNLTAAEQRKVQEQLMDIIKSIPSLAIFLLPGGAILLPLFIKFIPKLLPSAFDENRIEE